MFLFKKSPDIKGHIGYYKLEKWYVTTFSQEERNYMENKYQPMSTGGEKYPLIKGNITFTSQTVAGFLSGLATFFEDATHRSISERILLKAESEGNTHNDVLGLHFTYLGLIKAFYRDRDKETNALEKAIKACEKQIALAPKAAKAFEKEYVKRPLPSHTGFEQLAIIREKQNAYEEVIRLSKEAKKQGWAGDWDGRIERCEKKLSKQKQG